MKTWTVFLVSTAIVFALSAAPAFGQGLVG